MIDTLRLRVLHTKRLTIGEIAREMDTSPGIIEAELKKLGYTPIYRREASELSSFTKKNKEENNVPKGVKTPVEKIAEIKALSSEGKSQREIAEITNIPQAIVSRVCQQIGIATIKEPAPAATDTSSDKIPVHDDEDNSTSIIVHESSENVKSTEENSENQLPDVVMEAMLEKREDLIERINEEEITIRSLRKNLSDLNAYIRKVRGGRNDGEAEEVYRYIH